jgi:hypothetical protein
MPTPSEVLPQAIQAVETAWAMPDRRAVRSAVLGGYCRSNGSAVKRDERYSRSECGSAAAATVFLFGITTMRVRTRRRRHGTGQDPPGDRLAADLTSGGCRLVVCPASVKRNWAREISLISPDASTLVIDGTSPVSPTAEWIIINYDILGRHIDDLLTVPWAAIVFDEAGGLSPPEGKGNASYPLAGGPPPCACPLCATSLS